MLDRTALGKQAGDLRTSLSEAAGDPSGVGLPIAWALAGGYQEEKDGSIPALLEIHRNTAVECIDAFSG